MRRLLTPTTAAAGTLSRDEIMTLLKEHYIMKYTDFYTGMTRGMIDEAVLHTLLDTVDKNGDGVINYDEFASVVMAGANTYYSMETPQHGVAVI
jgi:Ca2+-binding EF-hand superfamily protein